MSIVGCRSSSRGPRGSLFEGLRVLLATLVLIAAVAIWSPTSARADTAYPVLLVHGANGSPANFDQMVSWLRADGYDPYTVDLGIPGTDTRANAKKIGTKVDEIKKATGADKVYLVGHSMGGLSARYYIKVLDGLQHVASYTAFGVPQHGHPPLCFVVPDLCTNSPILKALNRDDDTPGSIPYTSIASRQAHPEEANGKWAPLDHGACLPLVDGGPHPDEPRNMTIYQAVKDGLNGACPSGWTDLPDITP
jgi:triacylglycerol lipase